MMIPENHFPCINYLLLQHRDEVERFVGELGDWLDSPAGRFAAWLAAHSR